MSDTTELHREPIPTGDLDAALPASPVVPLRKAHGYRIAEGEPDIRTWEVRGVDGRRIGDVHDLLVDINALRTRYLEVALDPDLRDQAEAAGEPTAAAAPSLGAQVIENLVRGTLSDKENELTREHHLSFGSRHILIPIGFARLDPEHDRILVGRLRAADAAGLSSYDGQRLDREAEASLLRELDQSYTHAPERDFYAHDLFDEDRFFGPRRQRTDRGQAARAVGLEPGGAASPKAREITGELDRAVDAREEEAVPARGRS